MAVLLTWACEGCGAKRVWAAGVPLPPTTAPVLPFAGWGLLPDAERGAVAFCPTCYAKTRARMETR